MSSLPDVETRTRMHEFGDWNGKEGIVRYCVWGTKSQTKRPVEKRRTDEVGVDESNGMHCHV